MTAVSARPGVDIGEFTGQRESPTHLHEVYRRDPVLASETPPEELTARQRTRSYYLPATGSPDRPALPMDPVAADHRDGYWRVDLPVEPGQAPGVLPGRTRERERPQSIAAAVDRDVGFNGYRPAWQHALPTPRPLPGRGEPAEMRRINGRPARPLYVFGPDDRQAYGDTAWPWGVVGKIYTSGGWSGSGALIGPRIVMTAGHVVPWGGGDWWMRFIPAYYDGGSLHGAGVESYVSDAKGFDVSGDVTGFDWAVLRLYEPLGDLLGYFGYNGYSEDWDDDPYWTVLGYPGAVAGGQRPSWQGSVSVFDVDSDSNGGSELETRADMTPGNSGGPMFGWWGSDPRLVGVVSGEETDWIFPAGSEMGNVVAGGAGFTNLAAWGRTNWP
jgi:V8-like Glu-specific endopeptidase